MIRALRQLVCWLVILPRTLVVMWVWWAIESEIEIREKRNLGRLLSLSDMERTR